MKTHEFIVDLPAVLLEKYLYLEKYKTFPKLSEYTKIQMHMEQLQIVNTYKAFTGSELPAEITS